MKRAMRVASIFIVVAAATLASATAAAAQITVYVVRHGEKAATPPGDPPLSPEGEARARALVDTTKRAGIDAIITTQFARTKGTAAPTAAALGITPEVVGASGPNHVQEVAAAVRAHPWKTVLVVGHSNTVPAIVAALGAEQPAPICDAEYDNIYVVRIAVDGKATVTREHYGVPTPVGPHCAAMK